eukprot:CAMPEP_0198202414 /NCGR_PEP_ID=MMETSP1445-20131203/5580_1 /TAXON_ID=36898 /ORGANISM="Pyramimonas sp., Strain CCMP2087" /LENGTH=257 /DNA_ID=CAMNT_0043873323 /DNA_START=159 /DNA_END=932 /DNA_ORIENTATION=-
MAGDVGNKMDRFFESLKFDNWAPRSARAWGKGDYLNLSKDLPKQNGGGGGLLTEALMKQIQEEELNRGSLVEGGDARQQEMAQAFIQRVSTLDDDMVKKRPATYSIKDRADELNAEDYFSLENALQNDEFVLDGEALAILCYNKYGYFHDMAIKQDCMNKGGMARWVALNLYFGYVGLRGFPYSDAEYIDKCDAVAAILCHLDCEEFVYEWFQEKPMPRRGLPSRPRQDTAVTLQLNRSPTWDQEMAEEWFSSRNIG